MYPDAFAGIRWTRRRFEGLREAFEHGGGQAECLGSHTSLEALGTFLQSVRYPDKRHSNYGRLHPTLTGILERGLQYAPFVAEAQFFQKHFKRVFENALSRAGVTAWVCCNDTLGCEAMRFLEARHVRIPDDIAAREWKRERNALEADSPRNHRPYSPIRSISRSMCSVISKYSTTSLPSALRQVMRS